MGGWLYQFWYLVLIPNIVLSWSLTYSTESGGQVINNLLRILEVPGSDLGLEIMYTDWGSRDLPQFQKDARILPYIWTATEKEVESSKYSWAVLTFDPTGRR
jgi:hypothetical protein